MTIRPLRVVFRRRPHGEVSFGTIPSGSLSNNFSEAWTSAGADPSNGKDAERGI